MCIWQREVNDTYEASVRDDTFENEIGFGWYIEMGVVVTGHHHNRRRCRCRFFLSRMLHEYALIVLYILLMHKTNHEKWEGGTASECRYTNTNFFDRFKTTTIAQSVIAATTTTKNNKIYDQLLYICVTYRHIDVVYIK